VAILCVTAGEFMGKTTAVSDIEQVQKEKKPFTLR
jgi:hypothetical protein